MIEMADKDGHIRAVMFDGSKCESCRYYSDRIASWHLNGQLVKALCLNKDSPNYQKYQPAQGACSQYSAGVPIDVRNER